MYGKRKSLGEVIQPGVLTIRCSIIGPPARQRQGLLGWFLSQHPGAEMTGYTDYLWNGVTTLQLATLFRRLISEDHFDAVHRESPVHHFCPNKAVSKYELLMIFNAIFKKAARIIPVCREAGALNRILATRYRSLPHLFGSDLEMERAVQQLMAPQMQALMTE